MADVSAERVAAPPELQIIYHTRPESLSPDWYVLSCDGGTRDLAYNGIRTRTSGVLLTVAQPAESSAGNILAYSWWDAPNASLIGWLGEHSIRYSIDLRTQVTARLGEMCNSAWSRFSPSGNLLATLCDRGSSPGEAETWIEIDLMEEPKRVRYELPVALNWNGPSSLRWLSDNSLAFLGGATGFPCVLDMHPYKLSCVEGAKRSEFLEVSEDGRRILVWSLPSGSWDLSECRADTDACPDTWRIFDADCIRESETCAPSIEIVAEASLQTSVPIPSPNGEVIAFVRGFPDSSDVGIVNVRDGAVTHLGTLGGYFGFVDWCPDSTCFLVAPGGNHPYAKSYFIYLDGHQEPLDIADPMAILEIP